MGSRVNVVIVRDGAWRHYGSNGLGYSMDAFLALGPGPALSVFEAHPVWERATWQYDSSCEAGALIDAICAAGPCVGTVVVMSGFVVACAAARLGHMVAAVSAD